MYLCTKYRIGKYPKNMGAALLWLNDQIGEMLLISLAFGAVVDTIFFALQSSSNYRVTRAVL